MSTPSTTQTENTAKSVDKIVSSPYSIQQLHDVWSGSAAAFRTCLMDAAEDLDQLSKLYDMSILDYRSYRKQSKEAGDAADGQGDSSRGGQYLTRFAALNHLACLADVRRRTKSSTRDHILPTAYHASMRGSFQAALFPVCMEVVNA